MVTISPYNTELGSIIENKKLNATLEEYVIRQGEDLSYEFETGSDVKLAFITGKNDKDKDLPIFNHPTVHKTVSDRDVVFTDLRPFVKPNGNSHQLADIVSNSPMFTFEVLRTLLIADLIDENYSNINNFSNTFAPAFTIWLSKILTITFNLDPYEKGVLNLTLLAYILTISSKKIDNFTIGNLIIRLKNIKTDASIGDRESKSVISDIESIVLDFYKDRDEHSIDLLFELISGVGVSEKLAGFNYNVLSSVINNSWYGHNSSELVLMSLEHIPTLISLIYTGLDSKVFKKTKLTSILMQFNRILDSKNFTKNILLYLNGHTV